jgi:hypothetical protein
LNPLRLLREIQSFQEQLWPLALENRALPPFSGLVPEVYPDKSKNSK